MTRSYNCLRPVNFLAVSFPNLIASTLPTPPVRPEKTRKILLHRHLRATPIFSTIREAMITKSSVSPFQPRNMDLVRQNTREWTEASQWRKRNEIRGRKIADLRRSQNGTMSLFSFATVTCRKLSKSRIQVNTLVESSYNTNLSGTNYTIHRRFADRCRRFRVWISTGGRRTELTNYIFSSDVEMNDKKCQVDRRLWSARLRSG